MHKKIQSLFPVITLLMAFILVACGTEGMKTADQKIETTSTTETGPTSEFKTIANQIQKDPEVEISEEDLLKAGQFMNEHVEHQLGKVILEKLVREHPDNPIGKLLLANNYRELEKFNESLQLYAELVKIDSIKFIVLAERARVYIALTEFDLAKADIDESKSLQPKYFAAFLADGLLKLGEGKAEEALDLLEIAMSLDPGMSAEAALFSGYILLRSGVSLEAMEKLSKAIDNGKFINKGYAFVNRGVAQMNLADTTFACIDFDSAYYYLPQETMTYISQFCQGKSRYAN